MLVEVKAYYEKTKPLYEAYKANNKLICPLCNKEKVLGKDENSCLVMCTTCRGEDKAICVRCFGRVQGTKCSYCNTTMSAKTGENYSGVFHAEFFESLVRRFPSIINNSSKSAQ
jgi:hypothetical protein